jgi:hypothetical protein
MSQAAKVAEEESGRRVSQLREAHERELASEREGLTGKLRRVEEEVGRLRECSEAERASTTAAAQQEVRERRYLYSSVLFPPPIISHFTSKPKDMKELIKCSLPFV